MTKRPTILMLKGLPASGKTTYARELVDQGYVRVNKDDLRRMLNNGKWSKGNEKRVLRLRDQIIREAVNSGSDVVVDDTNFEEKHFEAISSMAQDLHCNFEVLFIDTPIEDCIKRNETRINRVPVSVIVTMHNKYIAPLRNEKVVQDEDLEECIIIDIDGTLAHISVPDVGSPRNPYDASLSGSDTVDDAVSNVAAMAYGHGYKIILLTGRHSGHLQVTKDWLEENGISYDEIYCREEGDKRPDEEVKQELYERNIAGKYNVKYVIDDRPKVCRMWRRLGLFTFQVGDPHHEF